MKIPAKKGILTVIILIVVLLGIQIYRIDIYRKPWNGPVGDPAMFTALDENGKVLTYTFLKDDQVLFTRASAEVECIQLMNYSGVFGNQFFDFLWKTPVPDWHWAQKFTLVEKGFHPISLSMEVLKSEGEFCLGVPRTGKTVHKYAEFDGRHMKLDDKVYIRFKDPSISGMDIEQALLLLDPSAESEPAVEAEAAPAEEPEAEAEAETEPEAKIEMKSDSKPKAEEKTEPKTEDKP